MRHGYLATNGRELSTFPAGFSHCKMGELQTENGYIEESRWILRDTKLVGDSGSRSFARPARDNTPRMGVIPASTWTPASVLNAFPTFPHKPFKPNPHHGMGM